MTIFKYKFLFGLSILLLSLNSCIINREMMFKTPKDGSFKYDSIPLYPYEEYKIAVGDKISFDLKRLEMTSQPIKALKTSFSERLCKSGSTVYIKINHLI